MSDFYGLDVDAQARCMQAAAQDALHHWQLEDAELHLIKYRENAVFRVESTRGRHALRLHRHGYHTDDELRSELQWMQALAEAGIHVPEVVPASSGQLFVHHRGDGLPGTLQIDVFDWIDGEQAGSVEAGIAQPADVAAIYGTIGELAAKVHNQAVSWTLPPGFARHAWDADGLAGENPFWGRFWELEAASGPQRRLLERGRDAVYAALSKVPKSPGTYSMIHADFVPENIMVHGAEVRLIDFDDAGFGWHLFELVTSLYFVTGEAYFDEARDALIAGYRRHRQLTDAQLELLPLFFMARGFTYVGWVHTRQETETAQELTPMLLDAACTRAEEFLSNS